MPCGDIPSLKFRGGPGFQEKDKDFPVFIPVNVQIVNIQKGRMRTHSRFRILSGISPMKLIILPLEAKYLVWS